MTQKTLLAVCGTVLLVPVVSASVLAGDYFLTVGGGYSPTGNQISLEKNVLMFRQLLAERYPGGAPHDVFFSDGHSPGRDVQFIDPDFKVPLANLLLARVFRQARYLQFQYRDHRVPGIRGGSNRRNLQNWFQKTGSKLKQGDRLFVYVTAHGGKSRDRKKAHNTVLYVWNSDRLAMTDMVKYLDMVSPKVPVVMVMVQCYAGGFANIIFKGGDAAKGFTRANRCGFFATVHTRPAAGCTADVNEANYREYSSYFWDAIRGRTRDGATLKLPDYNGDGIVTFDEAHAYALLTSTTIDISMKTSDAFLRKYSRTSFAKRKTGKRKGRPVTARRPRPVLITADTPFEKLVAMATPAQRAVLRGLSQQLTLKGSRRGRVARALAGSVLKKKKKADAEYRKKVAAFSKVAGAIKKVVINRWPELANAWHPQSARILQGEADRVVKLIESHPKYKSFETLRKDAAKLSKKRLDLDRKWAKIQRLIRTLDNVALAANLPKLASPDVQRRYRELLKAEAVTLAVSGPVGANAAKTTRGGR